MTQNTEIQRVEEIRKMLKISKKDFSKILGYAYPQNYTKFLNGSAGLSLKMIQGIIHYNSQINSDWIITGEGTMLKVGAPHTKQTIKGNNNVANIGSHNQIAPNSELDQLRVTIQFLQSENKNLKDLVATQKELISMLKNKTKQQ